MTPEIGATTDGSTVHDWVRRLAKPVGDPGGGAAAGVMLAMACALTAMVAGYAAGDHEGGGRDGGDADGTHAAAANGDTQAAESPRAVRERADARRERALELADIDARRSTQFGAAFREPSGERRDRAVRAAGAAAAGSSADLADLAIEALGDLEHLAPSAPPFLRADVKVAAAALRAALTGARANLAADVEELTRHGGSASLAVTADLDRLDDGLTRLTALER